MIEDEDVVRELSVRILTRAGYQVAESANGLHAWDLFRAEPDSYELLFVDVRLPGIGGEELARRVQAVRPTTAILLTSGLNREYLDTDWLQAQGIEFLAKPFNPDTLLARIRMILDGKRKRAAGK